MKSPHEIAEQYLAAWNETDAPRRRALVEQAFGREASYQDPLMSGAGHAGIDAMIAGAQVRFPGMRFTLAGTPDGHHDVVRFSWTLAAPGQAPVAHGSDVATIADGRISTVIGFLDKVSQPAA